jgi:FKBP12-rapamycin complex-associated protein
VPLVDQQNNPLSTSQLHIDRARDLMATDFAALVGESYERAYSDMVRVQQLAELDEVVQYKKALAKKGGECEGRMYESVG